MKLGPSFPDEIQAAGLNGLPISYTLGDDAQLVVGALTPALKAKLDAVIAAHDPTRPASAPVTVIAVLDLYRRMTDEEFAKMQVGVASQSPRIQGIFQRADTFRSDAPEWPLLVQMAHTLYGDDRAAELLTPTP